MDPISPPASPSYVVARDTSIVATTTKTGVRLGETLASWLANDPLEIIIVTIGDQVPFLNALIDHSLKDTEYSKANVTVLAVPYAGKRKQMAHGLERAKGSITVLANDDVFWQPLLLRYILARSEDKALGGVGTRQRAYLKHNSSRDTLSIWHRLDDRRLAGRNKRQAAMSYLDGGLTCYSGRTAAYRSEILESSSFTQSFTQNLWLGRCSLDSGDDTFCTRWLIAKGWHIRIQTAPEAGINAVVLDTPLYLKQILRRARNLNVSLIRYLFGVPKIWGFEGRSFQPLCWCRNFGMSFLDAGLPCCNVFQAPFCGSNDDQRIPPTVFGRIADLGSSLFDLQKLLSW